MFMDSDNALPIGSLPGERYDGDPVGLVQAVSDHRGRMPFDLRSHTLFDAIIAQLEAERRS